LTNARQRRHYRTLAEQATMRLAAIRAVIDLAGDDDDQEVAAEALLVLGASHTEIEAASFGPAK